MIVAQMMRKDEDESKASAPRRRKQKSKLLGVVTEVSQKLLTAPRHSKGILEISAQPLVMYKTKIKRSSM